MHASLPTRLAPEFPFPPYAFVPGKHPHPTSDPRGHSFGQSPESPPTFDPEHWQSSAEYRFAIDLFNFGYYWEAHEALEGLWHACGRRGPTADFLKALIHLAAAGVKVREGKPAGVQSHARRAAQLLRTIAESQVILGLRLEGLIDFAERTAACPPTIEPVASNAAVAIVFDFVLVARNPLA